MTHENSIRIVRSFGAVATALVLAIAHATMLGAQGPAPAEQAAAARVADAVCDKRVVLLGELPEHGEARGEGVKARIVQQLVSRCGFRAVLFESGTYDFIGLERSIAAKPRAPKDSLELALARAIGGLWWTRELSEWRRWLLDEAVAGRLTLGGIDDQVSATAAYAKATLPELVAAAAPPSRAAECRAAVIRYLTWGYTDAQPYDGREQSRLAECSRLAADRAPAGQRSADAIMLDDLASFFARENGAANRTTSAAADRDDVMARHVAAWIARLPRDAKVVVWTASVHASRVAPSMGSHLAAQLGDQLAAVGFTALDGQWGRSGREPQALASLPAASLEARSLAKVGKGEATDWVYLDRRALRSLGKAPSRILGKITDADWSSAFDGVLVIRTETPPAFEPRRE